MKKNYDLQYFINKFSKISMDKWCAGFYVETSATCAIGHCGVKEAQDRGDLFCLSELKNYTTNEFFEEAIALGKLLQKYNRDFYESVYVINDTTRVIAGNKLNSPKLNMLRELQFKKILHKIEAEKLLNNIELKKEELIEA